MAIIDLHIHSSYSDGTLSPGEIVALAAVNGVKYIAITDHDEVAGVGEAMEAGALCGVEVIPGVEINTDYGRQEVHILGYGFPVDSPIMLAGVAERKEARIVRIKKMVERLGQIGKPVELDRVLAIAGHGSAGRPHLAKALFEAGQVRSYNEAFDKYIGYGCPAYIPRTVFTAEDAIKLIHAAGGVAVLAHPGKLSDPHRLIMTLLNAGLDGIEAFHFDHSIKECNKMLKVAKRHGLICTGGSDYHGSFGPRVSEIGSVAVPDDVAYEAIRRILKKI
jgi:predicted metal-dependent phosphoesterase TrpH